MTKESEAKAVVERLRGDLGGNNLGERIGMEVLRLRLEGQAALADAVAALSKEGNAQ